MANGLVAKILKEAGLREAGDTGVFIRTELPDVPKKAGKKIERDAIKRARRLK